MDESQEVIKVLVASLDRLHAILREYGRHDECCSIWTDLAMCDCGLSAKLAGVKDRLDKIESR